MIRLKRGQDVDIETRSRNAVNGASDGAAQLVFDAELFERLDEGIQSINEPRVHQPERVSVKKSRSSRSSSGP